MVTDLVQQWNYASNLKKKERLPDIEEQAERDLYVNLAVRNIEDVVTDLAKDDQHFCEFCYELRVQDLKDEYTHEFLYGQVKPHVLVEIVQSNVWDPVAKEMKVKDNHCFVMANLSSEQLLGHRTQNKAVVSRDSTNDDYRFELQFLLTPHGFKIMSNNRSL